MIEARKPEPRPGWSPFLWPKPMTIERIFLEARLNSWTYLVIALPVCWISVGAGAFFIWNSLYGSQPWQPTRGILVGMLLVIVFSVIGLFVIAVMIAKVIFLPYRVFRPDYEKIDRLLPIHSQKNDR